MSRGSEVENGGKRSLKVNKDPQAGRPFPNSRPKTFHFFKFPLNDNSPTSRFSYLKTCMS